METHKFNTKTSHRSSALRIKVVIMIKKVQIRRSVKDMPLISLGLEIYGLGPYHNPGGCFRLPHSSVRGACSPHPALRAFLLNVPPTTKPKVSLCFICLMQMDYSHPA